jgi:small subunit ribosomal protein S14
MAKTSSIEKNNRRRRMTAAQAPKRSRLKALAKDKKKTPEERFAAQLKLAEMPRNGSKVRIRNRCEITGRPRGNYRKLRMCRNQLRELASQGRIPGMTKSSW